MADQTAANGTQSAETSDVTFAAAFAGEGAETTESAPETSRAETPAEAPETPADEAPAALTASPSPAAAPSGPAAPLKPDEIPAEWREHPAFKAMEAEAERARRFAPVIEGLEKDGLADAAAVQSRQQAQAQRERMQAHFAEVRGQVEAHFAQEIGARIDQAVADGDISEQYAQQLKDGQVKQATDAEMGRYQGEVEAQQSRQSAAMQQYKSDADTLLARPEHQVGGQPVPFEIFDTFARQYPQASLDQVAAHSAAVLGRLRDAWISAHTEAETKKAQAPRPAPHGAGGVPPAPAFDEKSITFGQALAAEYAQQR